jgi:RNA polymerase sigma factor (sigma-70 family)
MLNLAVCSAVKILGLMNKRSPKFYGDLIERSRKGDEAAWHELIDLIAPLIFAVSKRSRLSRDESFDIFGQVSLELVRGINALKTPEKIISFVATITRRKIYNFYKNMRVVECLDSGSVNMASGMDQQTPEEVYDNLRKREILMEALMKLPPRDCQLVKALFFDPFQPSYAEIAEKMNFPVSSIGPTRARALAKLYKILKGKHDEL